MFCSNFNFTIFSKVFTDILKIYELHKIYYKIPYCQILVLTIIIYQANSVPTSSGFVTIPLLTLLKLCPRMQRTLLAITLKKNPRQDIYLKCSAKKVLFCYIRYCPYSLQQALHMYWILISNLNNLSQPRILISSKYARFIVYCREQGQYLM